LPQHGMDYWPKQAKIIQIDADNKMLGLVKRFPSASAVMPRRCACPDRTSVWQNLGL
jgi:hypothetical protein